LGLARDACVLVPLCGKSLDMVWLAGEGHRVIGVEISPIAVEAFFRENALCPERTERPGFGVWRQDAIELWQGDFFDLAPEDLAQVDAIYDRASLIAMPTDMREPYAAHLMRVVPSDTPILLVTLEYDQSEMAGPPFSVSESEVEALYRERYHVDRLHLHDALEKAPNFRRKGLTALTEKVYLLTPV
jgi:thiopurine S-methyltransferase